MFNHKDTINWFLSLNDKTEKEIHVLQAIRKNCQKLIEQSRNEEAHVDNENKEKWKVRKEKDVKKKLKIREIRSAVLDGITSDGGVCKTKRV